MHYGQHVKRYRAEPADARLRGFVNFDCRVVAEPILTLVGRPATVKVFPFARFGARAEPMAKLYARLMNRRLGSGNPKDPWNPLHNGKRWCEDIHNCGLRVKGAAHDIINLRHTGWYSDDMQDETMHGVVLQMPASKEGFCRYLAGRSDPDNDGAALIDFSTWYDDLDDAARAADDMAEHDAEQEREYQEAWSMGSRASNHDDEAKRYRADLLDLLVSSKEEGRKDLPKDGTIYWSIVDRVEYLLDKMREERRERDKLIDDAPTYDKALRDAFNEGFGREVV